MDKNLTQEVKTHKVYIKNPIKGEPSQVILVTEKVATAYATSKSMKFHYKSMDKDSKGIKKIIDYKDIERIEEIGCDELKRAYGERSLFTDYCDIAKFKDEDGVPRVLTEIKQTELVGREWKELSVRYGYKLESGKYREVAKPKAMEIKKKWVEFFKDPNNRQMLIEKLKLMRN